MWRVKHMFSSICIVLIQSLIHLALVSTQCQQLYCRWDHGPVDMSVPKMGSGDHLALHVKPWLRFLITLLVQKGATERDDQKHEYHHDHVSGDEQVSCGPCKCHIPNKIKSRIGVKNKDTNGKIYITNEINVVIPCDQSAVNSPPPS